MDIAISLLPESAPFTAAQRAWLNGFLAGWLGLQKAAGAAAGPLPLPLPIPELSGILAEPPSAPAPAEAEAEAEPWHDPALPLDERLRLAEGETQPRRLMAAMAQLDCGACGYVCRTYSEAIASGQETRLTLCSPGGAETARTLKRLVKEAGAAAPNGHAANGHAANGQAASGHSTGTAVAAAPRVNGWSREAPFSARILHTRNLNGPGSDKETRHVELDLAGGPAYEVGDSLGIYPDNCGTLVDELIDALGCAGDESVAVPGGESTTLREALARHCCLAEVTEALLEQLAEGSAPAEARAIRELIDDDGPIAGHDVLDLLRRFPSARPDPAGLVAALAPLRPRLYSISSSPRKHPGQVHLTVRRVAYEHNGRTRKGVASTMLADRVEPGTRVRVFVQKSHGFTLPADPAAPIIMIGPGTGIAPFRAFLHERDALGASGKNWLVFGDQRSGCDFLYEDELTDLRRRGVLTHLDTAFSRDQEAKLYVQHRLAERGAELFRWLEAGAHVYVCGDAQRMARDVDRALRTLIREHGRMSDESAATYLARLAAAKRYCRDVY
jgi:sulfite reductase (NADPH) flavoprotein alpha-component